MIVKDKIKIIIIIFKILNRQTNKKSFSFRHEHVKTKNHYKSLSYILVVFEILNFKYIFYA